MKNILLLLLLLTSCSNDEEETATQIKVVRYEIYIKAVPTFSDVYFMLSTQNSQGIKEVVYETLLNRHNNVIINHTFDNNYKYFYAYFSNNTETFTIIKYKLTKYYNDGSFKIEENIEDILYSDNSFFSTEYINIQGNNIKYIYFKRKMQF